MALNGLKVQIAVSMQLQRALHDPSRGIRVLSSETIGHFLKKNVNFCLALALLAHACLYA